MTDRVDGCWVGFERDIRDDDVEPLLTAIRMIRGVAAVETHVTDPESWRAREQIRHDLWDMLHLVTTLALTDNTPSYLHNKKRAIDQLERALSRLSAEAGT